MTDAEIAGHMNWRGPGAYTQHQMKRIKALLTEAESREREACAQLVRDNAAQCTKGSMNEYILISNAQAIEARGQS